jgi:uncharacterized membrane protein (UPF0182 family)
MHPSQARKLMVLAAISTLLLFWAIPTAANLIIDYNWWKEVGQVGTRIEMLWYAIAPVTVGTLVAFIALWLAHDRGMRFAGARQRDFPLYSRLMPVGFALMAIIFAQISIDYWTVMRFFGSRRLTIPPDAWKDPLFSRPLSFYLFSLPFYSQVLGFVFVLAILCALVFWATARGWQLAERFRFQRDRLLVRTPGTFDFEPRALLLPGASRTGFLRAIAVILLLGLAAWFFLGNYDLLFNSHAFMTGADYVDEKVTLPLRWFLVVAILAAIPWTWGGEI